MALLIRCQKCKRFYSPERPECPKCETVWDVKNASKAFYHDFSLYGVRRRVKAKARNIHYAKVENDKFDPEAWWEQRKKEKKTRKSLTVLGAYQRWMKDCELFGCRRRKLIRNRPASLESKRKSFKNIYFPSLERSVLKRLLQRI